MSLVPAAASTVLRALAAPARGGILLAMALALGSGCAGRLSTAQAADQARRPSECRLNAADDGDACELRSADQRTTIKVSVSGDVGEELHAALSAELLASKGGAAASAGADEGDE